MADKLESVLCLSLLKASGFEATVSSLLTEGYRISSPPEGAEGQHEQHSIVSGSPENSFYVSSTLP